MKKIITASMFSFLLLAMVSMPSVSSASANTSAKSSSCLQSIGIMGSRILNKYQIRVTGINPTSEKNYLVVSMTDTVTGYKFPDSKVQVSTSGSFEKYINLQTNSTTGPYLISAVPFDSNNAPCGTPVAGYYN